MFIPKPVTNDTSNSDSYDEEREKSKSISGKNIRGKTLKQIGMKSAKAFGVKKESD